MIPYRFGRDSELKLWIPSPHFPTRWVCENENTDLLQWFCNCGLINLFGSYREKGKDRERLFFHWLTHQIAMTNSKCKPGSRASFIYLTWIAGSQALMVSSFAFPVALVGSWSKSEATKIKIMSRGPMVAWLDTPQCQSSSVNSCLVAVITIFYGCVMWGWQQHSLQCASTDEQIIYLVFIHSLSLN